MKGGWGELVVRLTGKGGIFWVGSTEPRANLNSGNNGLSREQRGGRLTASPLYNLPTQTAQGSGPVGPLGPAGPLGPMGPLSRLLFLFGLFRHNGPAATSRLGVVCRKDVTRLQERRVTKWRTIVHREIKRDTGPDSREDATMSAADESVAGLQLPAAVCQPAGLSSAAHFTYEAAAEQPSDPAIRGRKTL